MGSLKLSLEIPVSANQEFMLGRILMYCRKWLGYSLRAQSGKEIGDGTGDKIATFVTLHKIETGRYVDKATLDKLMRFLNERGISYRETDSHFILTLPKDAFDIASDDVPEGKADA